MNAAVIISAAVALLLLGVVLFLVLRRNPLQSQVQEMQARVEELLGERSRLDASLQHSQQLLEGEQQRARQSLADEQLRAREVLANEKEAARLLLATEREAARQASLAEQQRVKQQLDEQRQWVVEQTRHFETSVLAAAGKLMEERGKAFSELNQKEVNTVVAPFKEQLEGFRKRVDDIYAQDTHERGSLKAQIEQLTTLNQSMSLQAERLVNALTITSKSVGDWGETILERILEDSGLRRGHEYDLQVTVQDANGERQRPDAVIRLPESRHLVIDSKVSNKAWADYCAATTDDERAALLSLHLTSLRNHIRDLSKRAYNDSPELKSVDFVLMFVPVEAALLTAFVKDPALYGDAYRSRIVLVTPSTLMAVVKLVEGIWTFQKRKESADEIADAGRKLYEKLTTFAQSFVDVGEAIERAAQSHGKAMGQLRDGKGNAIRLAEQLKELGVRPAPGKQMPVELLPSGSADDPDRDG